jgi:hypothetical protein
MPFNTSAGLHTVGDALHALDLTGDVNHTRKQAHPSSAGNTSGGAEETSRTHSRVETHRRGAELSRVETHRRGAELIVE